MRYSSIFRMDYAIANMLYWGTLAGKELYTLEEIESYLEKTRKMLNEDAAVQSKKYGTCFYVVDESAIDLAKDMGGYMSKGQAYHIVSQIAGCDYHSQKTAYDQVDAEFEINSLWKMEENGILPNNGTFFDYMRDNVADKIKAQMKDEGLDLSVLKSHNLFTIKEFQDRVKAGLRDEYGLECKAIYPKVQLINDPDPVRKRLETVHDDTYFSTWYYDMRAAWIEDNHDPHADLLYGYVKDNMRFKYCKDEDTKKTVMKRFNNSLKLLDRKPMEIETKLGKFTVSQRTETLLRRQGQNYGKEVYAELHPKKGMQSPDDDPRLIPLSFFDMGLTEENSMITITYTDDSKDMTE